MATLREAYERGLESGKYWVLYNRTPDERLLRQGNPYTTYASGIKHHLAYRIGFVTPFIEAGKIESHDSIDNLPLYETLYGLRALDFVDALPQRVTAE